MSSTDFMPLDGWDHVELWVGNAKQAAYFYEHAFGFTRTAYAGPETGVRDRASYVLEQGDIRLVLTSGLRADSEVTQFACRHGDGARDIALQVPSADDAYRTAVQRGARGIAEPRWAEDEFGRVELSSIATVARPGWRAGPSASLCPAAHTRSWTASVPSWPASFP